MYHIFPLPFITLLLTYTLFPAHGTAVMGTTYPIPEDLKKMHFYNDDLAKTLEEKLDALQKKFQELEERAEKFKGVKKLTPFTYAKYSVHYTPEQVENFMKTGWIQTKKFGWSLSKKNILETLPPWMKNLENDIADLEAGFPPDSIPEDRIKTLNNTRRRISDFMATRKTYLTRLKKWDEWCRKGPWLIEEAHPNRLSSEIESLRRFISGEDAVCPSWLQEGSHASDLDADALLKLAEVNLEKKQKVWNWYYGFRRKPKGKLLILTSDGYRFILNYQIYGHGARDEALKKIKNGIEQYWKGSVDGIPFETLVHISTRSEEEPEDTGAVQVRIGAEDETVWPSSTALPYHFDESTVAHEFGHGFGFPDRYRDIYDFSERVYRTYQWDIFTLMSAQNVPEPLVTERDLKLLIENYLKDETVHKITEDFTNLSFPTK
jgi:hypothetical protein